MNKRGTSHKFQLEALEQRLLLSADSCAGAITDIPPVASEVVETIDEQGPASADSSQGLNYNPADELDGLFAQDDTAPDASQDGSTESQSGQEEVCDEVTQTDDGSSSSSEEDTAAGVTGTYDAGNALTEQLTEVLNAANGPPVGVNSSIYLVDGLILTEGIPYILQTGDTLGGTGVIFSGLVNNGFLNPGHSPGIITVENSFTQGPDGLTLIEIGGTSGPGVNPSGHDQISVVGDINLDGTVRIELLDPLTFTPNAGDSFVIFEWTGTRTGEIANWLGTTGIPGKEDLAFVYTYDDVAKELRLDVVATQTIVPTVEMEIEDGLDKFRQVGDAIEGIGEMAQALPLIGDTVGGLVDVGNALNAIANRIDSFFQSLLPNQSEVTALIEGWDGAMEGGFVLEILGVEGHYSAMAGQPFWWEVRMKITQTHLNMALTDVTEAVLGAVFTTPPMVDVEAALELDFAFGYDTGFFVDLESLTGRVTVDASGSSGPVFNFADAPGSPLSLDVTSWSVDFEAFVTATPDAGILDPQGRITLDTIEQMIGLMAPAISPGDAFNLNEGGTVDASLTLEAALTGFAFEFVDVTTVTRVQISSSDVFGSTDPDLVVEVDGKLRVLGQVLDGVFTLKKTATETILEAEDVVLELSLGVAPASLRILRAEMGSGKFLVIDDELAGTASLTITQGPDPLLLPNLDISGTTLSLALNTSDAPVATIDGLTVNLPAGDYYRVSGNAQIELTVPEVVLTGDFVFEPLDTDMNPLNGDEEIVVGVANLSVNFDDGAVALVEITDGEGAFVISDEGVTGVVVAMLEVVVPGVELDGVFSLTLNDTMAGTALRMVDVNGTTVDIPALAPGPYLRATGTHVELEILGIDLTGTFVFEQKTTEVTMEKVVTIAATNVDFPLGTLTGELVDIDVLSAVLILTEDGIAGQGTATVDLDVPGVELTGALTLRINDTEADVDEMVDVVGTIEHIDVPMGPYVQVNGDDIALTILGVTLTGDFSFEQRETLDGTQLVTVVASDVRFDVGTDIVSFDNGQGLFLITDSGIVGQASIDVTLSVFEDLLGDPLMETFSWTFNNTGAPVDEMVDWEGDLKTLDLPSGPFNRFSTGDLVDFQFDVAGQTQSLSAVLVLGLLDDDDGDFQPDLGDGNTQPDIVTVGVSGLSTQLGGAGVSLEVADGTGAFVIFDGGVAGKVAVDTVSLEVGGVEHGFIDLTATGLRLEFNNSGMDVGPVTVSVSDNPADDVTVEFVGTHFHNYLAVAGTAELELTIFGDGDPANPALSGQFFFELSGTGSSQILHVNVEDLELALNVAGAPVLSFTNGSGKFAVFSDGLGGTATLDFDSGLLGIMGTITLEINTRSVAINEMIATLAGPTEPLVLTETEYLTVCVDDGHITIGSLAFAFSFTVDVDFMSGDVLLATKGGAPLITIDGTTGAISIDPGSGIDLSNGFDQIGPIDFVQMLRALGNWLALFRDSDFFDIEIPFTGGFTLGQALDWAQAFADHVFSFMVSVELEATRDLDQIITTSGSLSLSGASFGLTVGEFEFTGISITDTATSLENPGDLFDPNTLVGIFNNEFQTTSIMVGPDTIFLGDLVEARINHSDPDRPIFAIALKPETLAQGLTLELHNPNSEFSTKLGYAPNDNDAEAPDQTAIETQRYGVEEFIVQLGQLLTGVPGNYDPNSKQFTFPLSIGWDQDPSTLMLDPLTVPVPFSFDQEIGPIGSVSLDGMLELTINASLDFTIGFDLNAAEVPRVVSSPLIPAPSNGRISEDLTFQILLNENPDGALPAWITLTLLKAETDGTITDPLAEYPDLGPNNNLVDLAEDLNELLASVMWNGTRLDHILHAQKAGSGLAISVLNETDENGNGMVDDEEDLNDNDQFDQYLGLINLLAARSLQDDPFSTELGFGVEATEDGYFRTVSKSRPRGLFIENASFGGSVGVDTTQDITGSLSLGFLEIELASPGNVVGTFNPYVGPGGTFDSSMKVQNPIMLGVSLMDEESGSSRFYISELLNGLEEANLAGFIQGPTLSGSFFAGLTNIEAGIGPISLPTGAEVSLWIPDITQLDFNDNPYDPSSNNEGIFLTYPDLGSFENFNKISFTQIIQALNVVVDSLSELSAFSFLDEKLPFIDVSLSDLVDYAAKFAELVEAVGNGDSDSIQDMIAELEDQIEDLFGLDSGDEDVFMITLDDGDGNDMMAAAPVVTAEGGGGFATATYNPSGTNNGLVFTSTSTDNSYNGVTIRFRGSHEILDDSAMAEWDANAKVLTITINGRETNANAIIAALADLPGTPWQAALVASDNPASGNTGEGTYLLSALKFSFNFTAAYANVLPFQLDLNDLVQQLAGTNSQAAAFLDAVTTFIQVQGSGVLTVSASASLELVFGLDLTNPCEVHPFFYDTTGIELLGKVLGTDIEFEASIGAIAGIKIKEGSITLDRDGNPATDAGTIDPETMTGDRGAEFTLGLKDNNGDGRHYFDEDWFDGDSIGLNMRGGVSAILPIFVNLAGTDVPLGSEEDADDNGYPDNQLVVEIPDLVRLFVDTQAEENMLGQGEARVRIPGAQNDLKIVRTINDSNDYTVVFQQDGSVGTGADGSFLNNTLTIRINSGQTPASAVESAIEGLGNWAVDPLEPDPPADDPMAVNDLSGVVTTSKIILLTPDISSLFEDLDLCDVINQYAGLLLDGLDSLLGSIQNGLNDVAYSTSLPLIGDGFAGAADFIGDFRSGLLNDLRTEIREAGSATAAIENAIKKVFWNLLGPSGLDILADPITGNPLDPSGGYQQLDVTLDCDDGLTVNLRLKREAALVDTSGNPIDFDLGVPGFGLSVEGNVRLAVGFDFKLGFGFNSEDGFFFDSSAPASDPELMVYLTATIPGLSATGTLLFLQLEVADNDAMPSHFTGQFYVDLMDPNGDGKLTFAELTSSGTEFGDIIDANLSAEADVNLVLIASFGGNAAFPRVLADFHLGWMFDLKDGVGTPVIEFGNIRLDLGTFLSDFLGPALSKIREVTEPFQPIIDAVTARIPVLSDLAGEDITLLDLAEIFGLLEPSTVDFIEGVLEVVSLINSLEGLGEGSILIPFGSFRLGADSSGSMRNIQVLEQAADDITQAIMDAPNTDASETYKMQTAGFVGDVGSLKNFTIPIFDNPSELFNLFIGEPVRLVEWRMPTFKFEFVYTQKIPIYPPLYAQFGGKIGATIDIGFGYDTFGIQKFIESEDKNVLDIFDGFYIIDFDTSGNDRPELTLFGELFAGASIDLLIVEAGVRGGIFAVVEFDLNDINDDGKVRISEIIALAQIDPRCIFNIHGEIGLFLEAFLIIDLFFFSIDKTWRFAEITLVEFDIVCPEPVVAEKVGSELLLNIGSRAGDREEIDTNDGAETFIVKHVDGTAGNERVEVQWGSYKQEFSGISKVVVQDAGQGDDLLDFRGVLSPIDVDGGVGNDTIYLSEGAGSIVHGGKGNDTIIASSNEGAINVTLHGDEGNDVLMAGSAAITIHGGDDADTITGSPLADMLFGDDGHDVILAGAGDDIVEGGGGNDEIDGETGNDYILAGTGNDSVRGSRGDDWILGEDGEDEIFGGSGNDLLAGGNQDDYVNGMSGIDVVLGDNYGTIEIDNTTVNQANLGMLIPMLAEVGITVLNLTGDGDANTGNDGDDLLVGGGNIDVLFGGDGDDYLYGGNFLPSGETDVIEEDHNDFFDGGRGNDVIFGDDAMGRTGDRNTGIAIKSGIFYDNDQDGRRGTEEQGFGGVIVTLYSVSDPFFMDPIDSATTEEDGAFEFVGLDPGSYVMTFTLPIGLNFAPKWEPATPGGMGATGADEDPDDNDVYFDGVRYRTDPFLVDYDETESSVAAGYQGPALVSISDVTVVEGNTGLTPVVFTVTLSGPQGRNVEIEYRTLNKPGALGASTSDGDYVFAEGTLVFTPGGPLTQSLTVFVNGDSTFEENQQFELDIVRAQRMDDTPVNLDVSDSEILGTILNDDPIPTINISDYTPPSTLDENGQRVYEVGEGENATFTITLSNPSQYDITVLWRSDTAYDLGGRVQEFSATPLGLGPWPDFLLVTDQMVTFTAGETTRQISVQVYDESEVALPDYDEPLEEHFFVDLYNSVRARIGDGRGIGIIPDDDDPVSLTIIPSGAPIGTYEVSVAEGNGGAVYVDFEVWLSAESGQTITVTYATSPGTAVEEVFSGDLNGDGMVDVIVLDRPDYVAWPNSDTPEEDLDLVFEPGVLMREFRIEITPDNLVEPDEFFFVNLLSADHADIARGAPVESNHVVVEIANDDFIPDVDPGPFNIRFSDVKYFVDEPETGTETAEITLIRAPGSSHAVVVFYTEGGTATPGADYEAVFRKLVVFGENEYEITVPITIYSDNAVEGTETVKLFLRDPTGRPTSAFPNQAELCIRDEDQPFLIVEGPTDTEENAIWNFTVSVVDKDGMPTMATYNIDFDYEFVSLTARNGFDFSGLNGSATILANTPSVLVAVQILEDVIPELTETFALRIDNAVGASINPEESAAIATIYDDDPIEIFGVVFYDSNGNGFRDVGEKSIKDVDVDVTFFQNGMEMTNNEATDQIGLNGDWVYKTNVYLGQVSIAVDGESVTSPNQGISIWFIFGSGAYETTTDNETQTIAYDGVTGLSPFEAVGYQNNFRFSFPSGTDDVGRGGTDDTIFGGPGNDTIDAGAGDDHVVGGHWMTATDMNAPINLGDYDAVVTVTLDPDNPEDPGSDPPLHNVYDMGPIFAVDTSALGPYGSISGQIWLDLNNDGVQQAAEPLYMDEVIVNLYDGAGNWVNSLVTDTGTYAFDELYLVDGMDSHYVIQFEPPTGFTFVTSPLATDERFDHDGILGGRTEKIALKLPTVMEPNADEATDVDAGLKPDDLMPAPGAGGFQFENPSYSVNENAPGYVTVTIVRGNATQSRAVIVRTEDGSAVEGVNYVAVSILLNFAIGETFKTVNIPILDSNTLDFCTTLDFTLILRDPTGRPLDDVTVTIFGEGAGTITDDDVIDGGDDWDLILGDSGNIPADSVIAVESSLAAIKTSGGPGKDIINGGAGPDYIDAQLGNDQIAGQGGRDIIVAGLGNDVIVAERSDDIMVGEAIDGGHGFDTVVSARDTAVIQLMTTGPTSAELYHRLGDGSAFNFFKLEDVEMAQLYGGGQNNTFDIEGWRGSAFVVGRGGTDTLLVKNNLPEMILVDASLMEGLLFQAVFGFFKDAALSLPNSAVYHLSSLEKVVLTGEAGDNVINAAGYSRPVTLVGGGGNDTLIGGSNNDTFLFDADDMLGMDTVTGNGGLDTLDFSATGADVVVNLADLNPLGQSIAGGNLVLVLADLIENATGGTGNDTLLGNGLDNVLLGGPGNDHLAGGPGDETYVFDTDEDWGMETIEENIGDLGQDTIDFSGTTDYSVSLNLSVLGSYQVVNIHLQLRILGEGVEQVVGGSQDDVLRGNSNHNTLRGGPGDDLLDGKGGNDELDGGIGNDDLDGGDGLLDRISESQNTHFTLTDDQLVRGTGEVDLLNHIEIADLTGGSSANVFTLTGWTGSGSVTGGGGFDTVIVAADGDFAMTATSLKVTVGVSVSTMMLSSIEQVALTGGPSANDFDVREFGGLTVLVGGPGDDTFQTGFGNALIAGGLGDDSLTRDLSPLMLPTQIALTNANLSVIIDPLLTVLLAPIQRADLLNSIENVTVLGGQASDQFDVSAWSGGNLTLRGNGGTDSVAVTLPAVQVGVAMAVLTDTDLTFSSGDQVKVTVLDSIEFAFLTGSDGDDIFDASAYTGRVAIRGLAGNDLLQGGHGNDILLGDEGDDRFVFVEDGSADDDIVLGGDGEDTLDFSGFTNGVSVDIGDLGSFQTVLAGELRLGLIFEDLENIVGGAGIDKLTGNTLDNRLTGGAGGDTIIGGGGENTLVEQADADFILTNATLTVGADMDMLMNIQRAELTGGAGDNQIDAGGFSGDTILSGLGGEDTLAGGTGTNILIGGAGDDNLKGNTGSDWYQFDVDSVLGLDMVNDLGGDDILDFSMSTNEGVMVDLSQTGVNQAVHLSNLTLFILAGVGIENVIGTQRDDILLGDGANNGFWTQGGIDIVDGLGGTNFIFENFDADYLVENGQVTTTRLVEDMTVVETDFIFNINTIIFEAGDSNNTMDASAFTDGAVIFDGGLGDDLLIGGQGADLLRGGEGNDVLLGGAGNDILEGEDGDDTLNGGASIPSMGITDNDTLRGGNGNDTYVFDLSLSDVYDEPLVLGNDTIVENVIGAVWPLAGYADTIQGIGLAGVAIDLYGVSPQEFYDDDGVLVLRLTWTVGTVEYSF